MSLVLLLVSNDFQIDGKNYFLQLTSSYPELLSSPREDRLLVFATAAHHWLIFHLGYQFCQAAAQLVGAKAPLFHGIMLFLEQGPAFSCAADEVHVGSLPQHQGSPPCSTAPELQLGIAQQLPVSAICLIIRG